MNKKPVAALLAFPLMGCSHFIGSNTDMPASASNYYQSGKMQAAASPSISSSLQKYVKQLVDNMAMNMRNMKGDSSVAVTTFVRVDSDLTQTSTLSLELAEEFLSELHRFGLTTLDFKATNYIRVTSAGDFVLTRDYLELKNAISADYVLVGTYLVQPDGIRVHARIIELDTQTVLATGETTIPPVYLQYVSSDESAKLKYSES